MSRKKTEVFTFWDHLEELRRVIFKILIVVVGFMMLAFLNKEIVFDIILSPSHSDFILYRTLCKVGTMVSMPSFCPEPFQVSLINTQLASQFLTHMSVSFYMGLVAASPYIVYQLFRFVSPALYENERKYSSGVIFYSCLLFVIGMILCYFIIFPLSFRFLGTYQVSGEVKNTITLSSYIDTFVMLMVMMGIVFELPIILWFFAKLGFIDEGFMKKYRRHAIVIILIIAAIITPTADIFTLVIVSLPIYFLYEISIVVVKRAAPKPEKMPEEKWENPYFKE
ncbi:MAG: twin-arginine translocase subunit TatC [Candidatus Azobacteroides sp.]|nr:twin-arginine translocase subunit TatC [Candidatus Azobacteroides sp.]